MFGCLRRLVVLVLLLALAAGAWLYRDRLAALWRDARGTPDPPAVVPTAELAETAQAKLDALGSDTSAPIGVMAFWPFSREHFQTPWQVFEAISRRYWRDDFWKLNTSAVLKELLVLMPVLGVVALLRMGNWRNWRT